MGRELRRVPANWEHPKDNKGEYVPLFDETYKDAIAEWSEESKLWERGQHPDQLNESAPTDQYKHYAEWAGEQPEPEFYRPDWADAPWFQVYETVSEGTPVTPPFAGRLLLVSFLCEYGTDGRPWSLHAAESFVKEGWMPSVLINNSKLIDQTQEVVE